MIQNMDESNRKLLHAIKHYQDSLERHTKTGISEKLLHAIDKLSRLPIQVCHLEETGVGRTVNALKKTGGKVGENARMLVDKWKSIVKDHEDAEKEAAIKNDLNEANKETGNDTSEDEDADKQALQICEPETNSGSDAHNSDSEESDRNKSPTSPHREHKDKSINSDRHNHKFSRHHSRDSSSSEDSKHKIKKQTKSSHRSRSDSSSDSSSSSSSSSSDDDSHSVRKSSKKRKSKSSSESSESDSSRDSSPERKSTKSHNNIKQTKEKKASSDSEQDSASSSKDRKRSNDISTDRKRSSNEKKHSKHKESSKVTAEKSKYSQSSAHKENKSRKYDKESYSSSSKLKTDKERSRHEVHKTSKVNDKSEYKKTTTSKLDKDHKSSNDKKRSRESSQEIKSSKKPKNESDKSSSHNKTKDKKDSKTKSETSKKERPENDKKKTSKASSSKENKSKETASNSKTTKVELSNGIDSESGASFADVLGMLAAPSYGKSKKKVNGLVQDKVKVTSEKVSKSDKQSKPSTSSSSMDNFEGLKLLKEPTLEPLDINISSLLPPITPNYKPVGFLMDNQPRRMLTDDEALTRVITAKHQRTKVYSGNKSGYTKVPTLFDMCSRIIQENLDALEYTGGVPYSILKPILDKATPQQLYQLEFHNPYLMEDSDELWQLHCQKDFRNKQREELETWREMYLRCLEEREAKLKALTANIKQAQDKSLPVRTTKLAYVDTVVKPPRNIAKKQAKNNTAVEIKKPSQTPSERLTQLAKSGDASKVAVPNPGRAAVDRGTSSSSSSSHHNSNLKPKKAPLMAKTLSLMKNRFGRR